jgi:hypothetical protein
VPLPSVTIEPLAEAVWVVSLVGEHDLATAPEVRQAIDQAAAEGGRVVIDLTQATFIDSTIIGAIVAVPGEPMVITAEGSHPRHALRLVHADRAVRFVDSRADALRAIDG